MSAPTTTDEEFIALFDAVGGTKAAKILGVLERNVYARRKRLEIKFGPISAPNNPKPSVPGRLPLEIKNGTVLVGSDFHIWPGTAKGEIEIQSSRDERATAAVRRAFKFEKD